MGNPYASMCQLNPMPEKGVFRTAAMERATGLSVLQTACDVTEGEQADKTVALGYIAAIFEDAPFSWADIMTGFHATIEQKTSQEPTPSPSKGPVTDQNRPSPRKKMRPVLQSREKRARQ